MWSQLLWWKAGFTNSVAAVSGYISQKLNQGTSSNTESIGFHADLTCSLQNEGSSRIEQAHLLLSLLGLIIFAENKKRL